MCFWVSSLFKDNNKKMKQMNKPLTFLLALTLLFLFSGSVYGEELEVKKTYLDNRKLKIETHYKNVKEDGLATHWYWSGNKKPEVLWKNAVKVELETPLYESGEKKDGDTLWIRMKT
jgi:antitoxin component YwqK of YwqJK toxin-antitoxin module